MFQSWRVQIREAERAYKKGRLDEAGRLLCRGDLREFAPGKRLSVKIADQLANRGEQRLRGGDSSAGWQDWQAAVHLAGETTTLGELRSSLLRRGVTEVEKCLRADSPSAAIEVLDRMKTRHAATQEMRTLRRVAELLESSNRYASAGDFLVAEQRTQTALALRPDLKCLQNRHRLIAKKNNQYKKLKERLFRVVADRDWNRVITLAQRCLQQAPGDSAAEAVLQRALKSTVRPKPKKRPWFQAAKENGWPQKLRLAMQPLADGHRIKEHRIKEHRIKEHSEQTDMDEQNVHRRFLLWIDAVGGFMVCPGDRWVIGQPAADCGADIPILGDISREHALIRRCGETYVLNPIQRTAVNGRVLTDPTMIKDGDLLELGDTVKLRFYQPHPLSSTARLEFVSDHRTRPNAKAIVLISKMCVMGSKQTSHIVCSEWKDEVVLFQDGDKLLCRSDGPLEIDGKKCGKKGDLTLTSRVVGDDCTFSLEAL